MANDGNRRPANDEVEGSRAGPSEVVIIGFFTTFF
jgi:hypothetical protein